MKFSLNFSAIYDKLCLVQIMIQEPHQVWYTYVMRGLAVVIFVKVSVSKTYLSQSILCDSSRDAVNLPERRLTLRKRPTEP